MNFAFAPYIITKMTESDLPHYKSFVEVEEAKCILCKTNVDDPIEYGNKVTYGDIMIHHFCAVNMLIGFI